MGPDLVTLLALAYLTVPVALFAIYWLRLPATLLVLALLISACFSVGHQARYEIPSHINLRNSGIVLVFALGWAALGGGSHFVYSNLDWVVRDAVIGDLTAGDWPPSYGVRAGGHDILRSATGFFLPIAFMGKMLGQEWLPWIVFLWTAIGTVLFLSLLPLPRTGWARQLSALLVIAGFSGMDVLGTMLIHGHYPVFPLRIEWWSDFEFRTTFSYSSLTAQLIWAPNHALPMWIGSALFYRHWRHPQFTSLLGVLLPGLMLATPFAFPGLAPFLVLLAIAHVAGDKKFPFPGAVVTLYFLVSAALILRLQLLDTGSINVVSAANSSTSGKTNLLAFAKNYGAFVLMEFFVLSVIVGRALRHSIGLWLVATIVLLALPLLALGPSNDLLLRVSTPSLVMLAILGMRVLFDASQAMPHGTKWLLILVLAIGWHTPFNDAWRALTWKRWPADYSKSLLEIQNGVRPPHYLGHLDDPVLRRILREPSIVPSGSARFPAR